MNKYQMINTMNHLDESAKYYKSTVEEHNKKLGFCAASLPDEYYYCVEQADDLSRKISLITQMQGILIRRIHHANKNIKHPALPIRWILDEERVTVIFEDGYFEQLVLEERHDNPWDTGKILYLYANGELQGSWTVEHYEIQF